MSRKTMPAVFIAVGTVLGVVAVPSASDARPFTASSKVYTTAKNNLHGYQHWCDGHIRLCRQNAVSHIPSLIQHRLRRR